MREARDIQHFLELHQGADLIYNEGTKELIRAEYRRNPLTYPDWRTWASRYADCHYFTEHDQVAVYLAPPERGGGR